MAGQDLEDLINKMNFNTPLRGESEEIERPPEKRVLNSNCSLIKSNRLDQV